MSFGIIFEVFGDKKLEVRWLLSWYVIVWTFVRTRCSLGHNKKRWKRLIIWDVCLLIDLFMLINVKYFHSSYFEKAWMHDVCWGRSILWPTIFFTTPTYFLFNHTNIFPIKPKGLQKCREIITVSIYDANVRKDFRFQYINKKIVSLSEALTTRKEWLVKEMFSSIN